MLVASKKSRVDGAVGSSGLLDSVMHYFSFLPVIHVITHLH